MYICDGNEMFNMIFIHKIVRFLSLRIWKGVMNTLNEVTEDFLSHINWQELRKVTERFFFYTLPGWT